jgi:nitroreductase
METWTAINTIRVIREFADRPLETADLDRILNAGRRTASSKNSQDWAFIVVRDRAHLRELVEVGRYASHLAGAAVAIALVRPAAKNEHQLATYLWDLGRAAQDMVLAAWELGIGSAPATVYDLDLAGRLLGLPDDRRCDFLLSFGYPADPAKLSAPNRAAASRSRRSSARSAGSSLVRYCTACRAPEAPGELGSPPGVKNALSVGRLEVVIQHVVGDAGPDADRHLVGGPEVDAGPHARIDGLRGHLRLRREGPCLSGGG